RSFWWCDVGYARIGGIRYDVTLLRGCIAVGWQGAKGSEGRRSQTFPASGAGLAPDIREPYFWFATSSRPTGHWGVMPMWFPLLIGLGTAAAPWLHLRFSLRTLLIATALVALGLGAIVAVA
ncbi:MAG TPA: hypothetical protein VGK58_06780, partial [Lacipirellulaceae bacterium]